MLRSPHKLEIIALAPLEIGRGVLPLQDECDIELLICRHHIGSFHPESGLRRGTDAPKNDDGCQEYLFHYYVFLIK